jgi:anaerobic magnesium-protoporphyrin IX monomethyl ester cyclase
MKVLFVHSEEDTYSIEKPLEGLDRMQFGISYISSLLKSEGHETRLVVPTRENDGIVDEHVRDFEPGLICFTSVYTEFAFLSRVAARVKRSHPEIFLLAGGPHASLNPDDCLKSAFDGVCVGEGEYPTLELVEKLENGRSPTGIPNLYIKRGENIERNPTRPFVQDLDELPFPDREMWIPWVANPLSRPSVLVGRGCPFQCTYCCNHTLGRLSEGKYVRLRSPQNIVDELLGIKSAFPYLCEAYLEVETLGVNLEWALELCSLLERMNSGFEIPIKFGSNLRVTPNAGYEELFAAFKRSNFRFINIGLESGSERLRRDVLKRNYSNQDIISAVQTARRHGLEVGMYNLIGIPGETKKDFRETIRVTRTCRPNWFLLSVFFPYPGTELHDTCLELGLLDIPPDPGLERRKPALNLPGFSKRQVGRRYRWSPLLFYGGYRPLKETLWLVFMSKISSSRRLLRYWRALSGGR